MKEKTTESPAIRRASAPSEHGLGVARLTRSIVRQRQLVWTMARRELTDMNAGQTAGALWLLVHPLLLFAVYAVLFTVIFRVRIGDRGPGDYLAYLFAGLAPWLLTQDVLARATQAVIGNASIVKKVIFPAEVLVAKSLLSSLSVHGVLLLATFVYIVTSRDSISFMLLLFPLVFFLHFVLLWGIALFLAAVSPYFRDTPEVVRIFVTINIYLMPVTYLPGMVPDTLRFVLSVNPFSSLIWCYQDVLYFGAFAHPVAWIVLGIIAAIALVLGSYVFSRLRHHFADVL